MIKWNRLLTDSIQEDSGASYNWPFVLISPAECAELIKLCPKIIGAKSLRMLEQRVTDLLCLEHGFDMLDMERVCGSFLL